MKDYQLNLQIEDFQLPAQQTQSLGGQQTFLFVNIRSNTTSKFPRSTPILSSLLIVKNFAVLKTPRFVGDTWSRGVMLEKSNIVLQYSSPQQNDLHSMADLLTH